MSLFRKTLAALSLCAPLATFAAPAAESLDPLFVLQPLANVYESDTVKHAKVTGSLSGSDDVAWYTFTGRAGQRFFADHDDAVYSDTLTDSVLSLFDGSGKLLAVAMDSDADPGSSDIGEGITFNAFLGTYILPADDLYYLAVSSSEKAPDLTGCDGIAASSLFQPGTNAIGGMQYAGCSAHFAFTNGNSSEGEFTLYVSLSGGTAVPVPEPGSLPLSLAGLSLAGLMARRRRR